MRAMSVITADAGRFVAAMRKGRGVISHSDRMMLMPQLSA